MTTYYPSVDCLSSDLDSENNNIDVNIKALDPLNFNYETSTISIDAANSTTNGYINVNNQSFSGVKNFVNGITLNSSHVISDYSYDATLNNVSNSQIASSQAIKTYIDNAQLSSTIWQTPIINFFDASVSLPVTPTNGDRYICSVAGNGWLINYLYSYTTAWTGVAPLSGYTVYVNDLALNYQYNGTSWIKIGLSIDHFDLINKGTNTHAQIDTHLSNTSNAHFGQDLKTSSNPSFTKLNITSTSDTTAASTGSLIVNGGTSILKNLNVEGNMLLTGQLIGKSIIATVNQDNATSSSSGALQIVGGVGIQKDVYIGGNMNVKNIKSAISGTDNLLELVGGGSSDIGIYMHEDANSLYGARVFYGSNDSLNLSVLNGSEIVPLIVKTLSVNVTLTQDATNSLTGSLQIAGGCGIQKELHVGTKISVGENNGSYAGGLHNGNSLSVISQVATSHTTLNDPQYIMNLERIGTLGDTYAAGSRIGLSRYENNDVNARTRLDIDMIHNITYQNVAQLYSNGSLSLTQNVNSSSVSTGSLIVNGGIGINGNLNFGDNKNVRFTGGNSTGNIFMSYAGVGDAFNLSWNGYYDNSGTFQQVNSNNNTTNLMISQGNVIIKTSSGVGNQPVNSIFDTSISRVLIPQTTEADNYGTGALQINGGCGVTKNLYIGGQFGVNSSLSAYDSLLSTFTGAATSDLLEIKIARINNVTNIYIPTSNNMTSTSLNNFTSSEYLEPQYRPPHDLWQPIRVMSNNVYYWGNININTIGSILISFNFTGAGFPSGVSAGWDAVCVSYIS